MKVISRNDLIKGLRKLGFQGPYSGGKHQFMTRGPLKLRVPNPHGTGDISYSLFKEILKQAGISIDDWNSM